jgi:hypothetical protein
LIDAPSNKALQELTKRAVLLVGAPSRAAVHSVALRS